MEAALDSLKKERKEYEKRQNERVEKRRKKRERIEQEATLVWRDLHRHASRQEDLEEEYRARMKERESYNDGNEPYEEDVSATIRWRVHPLLLVLFAAFLIGIFFVVVKPFNVLAGIIVFILEAIYTWNRMKVSKKPEKTESEILLEQFDSKEDKMSMEKLLWEIEHCKTEVEEKHTQYNNLREQLEEVDVLDEEDKQLAFQIEATTLAMHKIGELSKGMQKQMMSKLNQRISDIVCELTEGKYEKIFVDQDLNLTLIQNKQIVFLHQLSRGTIELVYFALRMAAAEILTEEKQPIILDDTFVCYDDVRLANVLRWIEKQGTQVLIFTCQNREKQIMEKEHINYCYISLS